jgi:hypothetical protein
MNTFWLPRYALLVASGALILLISGAVTTPDTTPYRLILGVVGLLCGGLWVLARATAAARMIALLGGLLLTDGLLGEAYTAYPKLAGIAHSCVLCAAFSLAVLTAARLSRGWAMSSVVLEDSGTPSLRSIALFSVCSLGLQVGLGASFRRDALPIIPHILGAMLAAAIILYLVMAVFMQYSSYRELMYPAIGLTGLIATQVLLGIGAYLNKVGSPITGVPPQFFSAAHIVTGSLTMAATALLTLRIYHHIPGRGPASQSRQAVHP